MSGILQTLVGRLITRAARVEDYIQIAFGDDVGISIYNDLQIDPSVDISTLVGRAVISADEDEEYITFILSGSLELRVGLGPEAFHGPEIMQLNRKGEPTVVWN